MLTLQGRGQLSRLTRTVKNKVLFMDTLKTAPKIYIATVSPTHNLRYYCNTAVLNMFLLPYKSVTQSAVSVPGLYELPSTVKSPDLLVSDSLYSTLHLNPVDI